MFGLWTGALLGFGHAYERITLDSESEMVGRMPTYRATLLD